MYDRSFFIKYIFRVAHILSVTILGGKIILNHIQPCQSLELSVGHKILYAILGVLLIVSGYVNMYLLKGKENLKENNKLWTGTLHIKLLSSVLVMTPLFPWITKKVSDDFPVQPFQFYYVIFWILVSSFLRYYREMWTAFHKDKKLLNRE